MAYKVLFKSIYGSRLYGTSTPTSDTDYKQIHMNSTDIMLTGKDSGCFNENTNNSGRNSAEDVDFESKELRTFIKDCLNGQTYAADLLYTPDSLVLEKSSIWNEIIALKHRLVTRNVKPYIGYVTSQASKYSLKGEKYNELHNVITQISKLPLNKTINDSLDKINLEGLKHFKLYDKKLSENSTDLYLDGPDCSFPCTRKLDEVLPVLKMKFKVFGRRAEEAASNDGLDLKAYYHALRVIWQLEEYLVKGELQFPSPKVQRLRDIRSGIYDKDYIEALISDEVIRILEIPNNLPEPDFKFWDAWLLDKYMLQAHEQSLEYIHMRGLR